MLLILNVSASFLADDFHVMSKYSTDFTLHVFDSFKIPLKPDAEGSRAVKGWANASDSNNFEQPF